MFDVGKAGECMQVGTRVCLTLPHVCTLYFPRIRRGYRLTYTPSVKSILELRFEVISHSLFPAFVTMALACTHDK